MVVAAFVGEAGSPFGAREKALLFLFAALPFLLAGGGRYALDALLRRR
jgi:uncharacterized membrane protein YphA (DoxX/SURF4 family)